MSYEAAVEYVNQIGEENITIDHLNEWKEKRLVETDTLKKRYIDSHIVLISNILGTT
tara:strand:- start:1391 stop:1561 length:171 start_codon:yes stop_codon:yes gene_type:complete